MNKFITQADLDLFAAASKRHTQWVNAYMGRWISESFNPGDGCEYHTARGWIPAQVLDYVIEDRPYYIIEYVDHAGRLREGKVRGSKLRKVAVSQGRVE